MFGHQDDQSDQQVNNDAILNAVDEIAAEGQHTDNQQPGGVALGATGYITPDPAHTDQPINDTVVTQDQLKDALSPAGGFPLAPSQRVHLSPANPPQDVDTPVEETPQPPQEEAKPVESPVDDSNVGDNLLNLTTDDVAKNDLATIKIEALDELYPLIDKLDLPPEERFRTLMMMIQASDNQELVKSAYETAHTITDEKVKAKALLDIVNEINYFTQQSDD